MSWISRRAMGLSALLEAVVRSDARAAADAYLGLAGADVDRAGLTTDLAALLRRIRERPLVELSVGEVLESLLRVGTRYRIRNPGSILLLTRAFFIAEALMAQLDPDMSVLAAFRDELGRLSGQRYAATRLASVWQRLTRDLERFIEDAPSDFRRSLRRIADGELGRVQTPAWRQPAVRLRAGSNV